MSVPPPALPSGGGKRGTVRGWSSEAAARHRRWLWSVDTDALDDASYGLALSLTLRECPASAADWSALRTAFLKRVARLGAARWHWVTEWQKRGVPHLHGAVFFDTLPDWAEGSPVALSRAVVTAWLEVAEPYGSLRGAQRVEAITDAAGWGKYCSKHSARSATHYQRVGMPAGWASSGRLWGHGGDWPLRQTDLVVDWSAFHQLRRLVRSWRLADARQEKDPRRRAQRILAARRMLQVSPRASRVWGLGEWVPEHVMARVLEWCNAEGLEVAQVLSTDAEDVTAEYRQPSPETSS